MYNWSASKYFQLLKFKLARNNLGRCESLRKAAALVYRKVHRAISPSNSFFHPCSSISLSAIDMLLVDRSTSRILCILRSNGVSRMLFFSNLLGSYELELLGGCLRSALVPPPPPPPPKVMPLPISEVSPVKPPTEEVCVSPKPESAEVEVIGISLHQCQWLIIRDK